MYVCVCNAVREKEVQGVIAKGVRDVDDVYKALGIEPQCGTCRSFIGELLKSDVSKSKSNIAA